MRDDSSPFRILTILQPCTYQLKIILRIVASCSFLAVLFIMPPADIGVGTLILPSGILQGVILQEVHLGREAVCLPLHLRAHSTVQRHARDAPGLSSGLDDAYL